MIMWTFAGQARLCHQGHTRINHRGCRLTLRTRRRISGSRSSRLTQTAVQLPTASPFSSTRYRGPVQGPLRTQGPAAAKARRQFGPAQRRVRLRMVTWLQSGRPARQRPRTKSWKTRTAAISSVTRTPFITLSATRRRLLPQRWLP
jgi:hypothetical protein